MSIATDSRKAVGRPAGTDSEKVRSNLMVALAVFMVIALTLAIARFSKRLD